MIDRTQLAAALGGLDPREREVLDRSLRRRVPDEALGETFGGGAEDVARLRTAAIGRLSEEMGVQRPADLGDMLKALLEPATWELLPPAEEPPAPRPAEVEEPSPRGAGRRLALGIAAAVALLGPPALVLAALSTAGDVEGGPPAAEASDAGSFKPHAGESGGGPTSSAAKSGNRYPTVRLRGRTALRERPRGKVKLRIADKTEFNSPRVLSVVEQRGDWLAVLAPELENGEVGWIEAGAAEGFDTVALSMHVDLSKRQLVVRRGDRPLRRVKIAVGRSSSPTPKGRYAVTDKLRVTDPGSPYGCCALALTGHQKNLPEDWPGGDRLAVHATPDTGALGQAVSLGCMRVHPRDAQWMLRKIPLGAPVFVRG